MPPVSDAQAPREVFDLFFRGAGEVAWKWRQRGQRDPVGVVHGLVARARVRRGAAGPELLEHGHQVGQHRALGADFQTVFSHCFAVVLLIRVHGHVAQHVDQHVQQPNVQPPAGAHLDQDEVAHAARVGGGPA